MILNETIKIVKMDQDTESTRAENSSAFENFNFRLLTMDKSNLLALQNEQLPLRCEIDNTNPNTIVGYQKIDMYRFHIFYLDEDNIIHSATITDEGNKYTFKEYLNTAKYNILYSPDEVIQTTYGEDTFAKYVMWTSVNSKGLKKVLIDYENVDEFKDPYYPYMGIKNINIIENGNIPQGMVRYFISTINDLGDESHKWFTDWYYIKDNNPEITKGVILTIDLPLNENYKSFIVYCLHSSTGGLSTRYLNTYNKGTEEIYDDGSGMTFDNSLLLSNVDVLNNADCLDIFQDRLFISLKNENRYNEEKWEKTNEQFNILTDDTSHDTIRTLADSSCFYSQNKYSLAIEFLDKNVERIKVVYDNSHIDLPNNDKSSFISTLKIKLKEVPENAVYARPYIASAPIQKFVSTTILNPTLQYYNHSNIDKPIYLASNIFRPTVYELLNKNNDYDKLKKIDYGVYLGGDNTTINLDRQFIEDRLSDTTLLNSSYVEFRHNQPLFPTGYRGNEFGIQNSLNGWFGEYYYTLHPKLSMGGFDEKNLWFKVIELPSNIPNYIIPNYVEESQTTPEIEALYLRNLNIDTNDTNDPYRTYKQNLFKYNVSIKIGKSDCFIINRKLVNAILPFNNNLYLEKEDIEVKIDGYINFKSSECYTRSEISGQGNTSKAVPESNVFSVFGDVGLVFRTSDEKYAYRSGICLPRIGGNAGWKNVGINDWRAYKKDDIEPSREYQYNVAYTPLNSPLGVFGSGVNNNQTTINIKEGDVLNLSDNGIVIKGSIKIKEILDQFVKPLCVFGSKDNEIFYGTKRSFIITALNNTKDGPIPLTPAYTGIDEYTSPSPNDSDSWINSIIDATCYIKKGMNVLRIPCGYNKDGFKGIGSVSEKTLYSPTALSLQDLKYNIIAYPYIGGREAWNSHVTSGFFDYFNRYNLNGEDSSVGSGDNQAGVCLRDDSYILKTDTDYSFLGNQSILLELSDDNDYINDIKIKGLNAHLLTASILNKNTSTSISTSVYHSAGLIQKINKNNPIVEFTEGDVYYGKVRYIPTLPISTSTNKVVDVIDINVHSTIDPNQYTFIEDNSLLLYATDYDKFWNKNPNIDSESTRQSMSIYNTQIDNKKEEVANNRIYWSLSSGAENIKGVSSLSKVFENAYLDLDLTAGKITKIIHTTDKLFTFQESKCHLISYNERNPIEGEVGLPIVIKNSAEVTGFTPITHLYGIQYHTEADNNNEFGIFYLDKNQKHFGLITADGNETTLNPSMNFWFNENISINDIYIVHSNNTFQDTMINNWNSLGFKMKEFIDEPLYATSLAYNRGLQGYTSFYNMYPKTLGFININDKELVIMNSGVYEAWKDRYCTNYYTSIILAPDQFNQKCFENIEYRDNVLEYSFLDQNQDYWEQRYRNTKMIRNELKIHPSFNFMRLSTSYQDSDYKPLMFKKHGDSNLKRFDRVWRIQLPRDKDFKRDRIKGIFSKFVIGSRVNIIDENKLPNLRHQLHNFILYYNI